MKKAIQVMATLVAFLLSGQLFAARVTPTMPPIKDVFGTSTTATIVGDGVKVTGGGTLFAPEFFPSPISKSVALGVEATVKSSAIAGLAKNVIKGGVVGVVASVAFDELLDGLDWVMKDGSVVKASSGGPVTTNPASGEYGWYATIASGNVVSTPDLACSQFLGGSIIGSSASLTGPSTGVCTMSFSDGHKETFALNRAGDHCPSGTTLASGTGTCVGSVTYAPLTDSDLSILDGFVKGKDGVWQRDLTNDLCAGKESCFQALSPTTQLTGPSTVSGTPQTVTTTSPSSGSSTGSTTTTSVKTPTATVTYGPNYYDTTTTTTTTTNNGGNTTTTTADTTPFPNVPDMLGGANGGFGDLKDGIPGTTSATSPIPYMPWYSFSQQCNEITLVIPVYGAFETALCPIYSKYIWPVLYFIFAVYTWVTCWGIWRNTVLKVRAS